MKNHNLGKKFLSVMMSIVMLVSCWVFMPTMQVAAADDTYSLSVYVHSTNSFESSDNSSYLYVWDKDGNLIYSEYLGADPWDSSSIFTSDSTAFTVTAELDTYPAHVQVTSYKNSGADVSTDPVFGWVETDGRIKITAYVDGVELGTGNSGLITGHAWITADVWTDASLIPVDVSEVNFETTDESEITATLQTYIQQALSYLKFDNDEIKGPSITLFDTEIYLFEVASSFSIDFTYFTLSFSMDYEARTFKVLIGFDESDSINGDPAQWSSTYDEVKDLYATSTSDDFEISEIWNDFSAFADRFETITGDYVFNAKVGVVGYMEFSFQNNDVELIEGGIITSVDLGFDVTIPFSQLPVFYSTFEIGGDLTTGIAVKEVTELSFLIDIEFDLPVDVGLGVGSKALSLYLEGGLTGTLGIDFVNPTGDYEDDYEDYLYIDITGGAYAEASIFGYLSDRYVDDLVHFELYPNQTADWLKDDEDPVDLTTLSASTFSLMSIADVVDVEEDEDVDINAIYDSFTAADRDYVETVSMARTFSMSTYSLEASADEDHLYSDTNVYDYSAPVITELENGDLFMVWVDDDGSKDDINKTSLMYSIYSDGVWSTAQAIEETGGANGAAVVSVADNGRVDIVWTKAAELDSTASLSNLMAAMEVYYISYEDGEFSEAIQITDNSVTETAYEVASTNDSVAITWTENSNGDILAMTDGTNSVYLAQIDATTSEVTTTTIASELEETVSQTLVYFADDTAVAGYVSDSGLVLGDETIEGASDVSYTDGVLYYLLGGQIVAGGEVLADLGTVDNFTVYDGNIYTLMFSNYSTEIYKSNDDYSAFVQVTNFDEYIREYTVATLDGETVYAVNLVELNDEADWEDYGMYGSAELLVCYAAEFADLGLGAVYYSDSDIVAGKDVTLSMVVTNIGNVDVDSINVTIGEYTTTVEQSLAVGESKTIEVTYTLPTTISYTSLDVTVSADDEISLDDNANTFTYGYADIVMNDLSLTQNADGSAYISGTVTNNGFDNLDTVQVYVSDTLDINNEIAIIEVGEVQTGKTVSFTYELPEEYLTIDDNTSVHSLTFKAVIDGAESSYANNSSRITFGELTNYSIYFIKDGQVIGIVDADEFESFDEKVDGYVFHGWYSNEYFTDSLLVESVDGDSLTSDLYLFGYYTEDTSYVSITVEDSEMVPGTSQTLKSNQVVEWSVTGATSEETAITESGYLTMSNDETAETITVTATTAEGNFATTTIIVHEHTFDKYYTVTPATCCTYGVSQATCSCGVTHQIAIEMTAHTYSSVYTVDVAATCTSTGIQSYHCMNTNCTSTTGEAVIAMLDHYDGDGDYVCDSCDYEFEQPVVEPEDEDIECSCICHSSSAFNQFIYKILCFFWSIFGMNETCSCGTIHY